jgi:hypothetical protein
MLKPSGASSSARHLLAALVFRSYGGEGDQLFGEREGMRTGQVARLARMRLTIGLLQGLALSGLLATPGAGAWPALPPYVFPLLLMGALFLPVLWQSGIGSLTGRQMGRWSCMALLLIVLLVALKRMASA